uniref:Uncharacterized protein n=1 Tax=Cacopsylla melanoneura TaxID=428564 RepID=A0A8D8YAC6_9HEMI
MGLEPPTSRLQVPHFTAELLRLVICTYYLLLFVSVSNCLVIGDESIDDFDTPYYATFLFHFFVLKYCKFQSNLWGESKHFKSGICGVRANKVKTSVIPSFEMRTVVWSIAMLNIIMRYC